MERPPLVLGEMDIFALSAKRKESPNYSRFQETCLKAENYSESVNRMVKELCEVKESSVCSKRFF